MSKFQRAGFREHADKIMSLQPADISDPKVLAAMEAPVVIPEEDTTEQVKDQVDRLRKKAKSKKDKPVVESTEPEQVKDDVAA